MLSQKQWAGTQLVDLRILVYPDELDTPQRQLGTIFIPPDPLPIKNARPENYSIDEEPVSTLTTEGGAVLTLDGNFPHPVEIILDVAGLIADI